MTEFRKVGCQERIATERAIRNPDLLRLVCEFLADTVGNAMSANGMAGALSQAMKVTDKTRVGGSNSNGLVLFTSSL